MSITNYTANFGYARNALNDSALSYDVAGQIIKSLDRLVKVKNLININDHLVPSDLTDKDIVYSKDSGAINLNLAKASDVSKLDALIFNSTAGQPGVNLTMNQGKGADAFKGWVVTYGTDDTIKLSGNGVKVDSGAGNDTVTTGNGNDSVSSGNGNDSVNTNNGNDIISSGNGNDIINSGNGYDIVKSGNGNDTVNSGNGNDSVISGNGNDSVNTGEGKDTVNTGTGNDSVNTGNGNDSVSSGTGNDSVNTGNGNDTVNTGTGNDTVITGAGNDTVYVDQGNNVFVDVGDSNDIIKLLAEFTGSAVLKGSGGINSLDLTDVSILDVSKSGQTVTITLTDDSVITAKNFQKFIYDSNGSDNAGGIETVGVKAFDDHTFIG